MERIVVGVDNSAGAVTALAWAASYAEAHSCRLEAVFVMGAERPYGPPRRNSPDLDAEMRVHAVESILKRNPSSDFTIRIVDAPRRGGLVEALRAAAEGAGLLAIGEADSQLHAGLAEDLSAAAACPVVEVRLDGDARIVEVGKRLQYAG